MVGQCRVGKRCSVRLRCESSRFCYIVGMPENGRAVGYRTARHPTRRARARLIAVLACALFARPAKLAAQITVPGASALEPTRIRYGTFEYVLSILRDGEEQIVGSITDEILPLRGDEPVIRRVQTTKRSGGPYIDSTATDAETMAPRWHHSIQPPRNILLRFGGARVQGTIASTKAATRTVDLTLSDLAFDASNFDLAIRALPLEEGEADVIQVYDVDRNVHRYSLRVADRELRGKSALIHITVHLTSDIDAHMWFDDVTRTLLRIETPIGPGVLLKQVLKP